MPCLACKYFQPEEPDTHKALRESGRCQSACGNNWNWSTAIHFIREHHEQLEGWCRLYPTPREVRAGDVCGQIEVIEYLFGHWGLQRRREHDSLIEWSREQWSTLINGTWEANNVKQLNEQNERLRHQLKSARKISASRLVRLQKQVAKQELTKKQPEQNQPELELTYPRLVAAE